MMLFRFCISLISLLISYPVYTSFQISFALLKLVCEFFMSYISFIMFTLFLVSTWIWNISIVAVLTRSFNFMAVVTIHSDFGGQEKNWNYFHFLPFYFPWSDGTGCHNLSVFLNVSFRPAFSLSSFTLIKRLFNCLPILPLEWHHLHIWGCWYFSSKSWFQFVSHPAWHFMQCTPHVN